MVRFQRLRHGAHILSIKQNNCISLKLVRYFGVDIDAIREYANSCNDIQHLRAEIRFVMA